MFTRQASEVGAVCVLIGMLMLVVALLVSSWKFTEDLYEGSVVTAKLTAVGAIGSATSTKRVLNTMHYRNPNAHMLLGDMMASDMESDLSWCDFIYGYLGNNKPITIVGGDEEGRDGSIRRKVDCMPKVPVDGDYGRDYFYDVPSSNPLARVFMISPGVMFEDGMRTYAPDTLWHRWLSTKIDEARKNNIPWIVVGMHNNCLSVTAHKKCNSGEDIMNILISKKVDLIIQAQERMYGRTSQLSCFAEKKFLPECAIDGWNNIYTKGKGSIIVFTGTGGRTIHAPSWTNPTLEYFKKLQGYNMNPEFGFLDLQMTNQKLRGAFISEDNDTLDIFTIKK